MAVARELHFARAAARLGVTQPALSQQVKALERELGVALLERSRRSVTLTPAGRTLLVEATDLLVRADRAIALTRATGEGRRGRLGLSYTRSSPSGFAVELVDAFRHRCPDVEVELHTGFTTSNIEQLLDGSVDIAFVRPPIEPDVGLDWMVVAEEELVVALPRGHALCRRSRIKAEWLREQAIVSWPRASAPGMYDRIQAQVWSGEAPRNVVAEEPDQEQMLRAVALGAGLAIITGSQARTLRMPGTAVRRFADPVPTVPLAIAWRRTNAEPVVKRFLAMAREASGADSPSWSRP